MLKFKLDVMHVVQWQEERLNFDISDNCRKIFLSENFNPKMLNFRPRNTRFGEFRGKIKILSTQFPLSKNCDFLPYLRI